MSKMTPTKVSAYLDWLKWFKEKYPSKPKKAKTETEKELINKYAVERSKI